MQYRTLGSSGLKVSVVGLGANNFGGRTDEARSIEVIQRALDIGVTTIDTADVYSQGQSEEIIGRALRGQRHRAELLTKVRFPMARGRTIRASAVSTSLRAARPACAACRPTTLTSTRFMAGMLMCPWKRRCGRWTI